jgi:diguanylate cyclase (GGDEF)-like protein
VALLYLDLDNFKPVNDRFGHAAGDHLLREVAARLRDTVRDSDTVARIGGDEFILLLPAVKSQDDVLAVGGKILQVLAEPFSLPGGTASVTASIGAAIYPLHGADGKELTRRADAAMYRAKELGRNNIQLSESAAVLDNPA